ncbi:MAG TPA: sensor histidine kinase, partial [Rudaea sp.]
VDRLSHGQHYFRRLARSVWRVQEDERRRLARDLHDGIGQNLTALVMLIDRTADALSRSPAEARTNLDKTRAVAVATLEETRALSRLLRPQILDDLGLEPALRWLTRTYTETHNIDVSLDIAIAAPILDGDQATLVFRVVQEALTNAVRHSGAERIEVILRPDGDLMLVQVRDDGRGCDLGDVYAKGSEGRSSGIGGMRDRVRLFGGDLQLESQPGGGFCATISFPMRTNGVSA